MTLFDDTYRQRATAVRKQARTLARRSDPVTAHQAAKKVESGNGPLMAAIRQVVASREQTVEGPVDAYQIARLVFAVFGGRWQEDSIRTAVSRAPFLKHVDNDGLHRGRAVRRYQLKDGA